MPIYAYRCDACGLRKDVLQKMSDLPLTVCPSCGAESFAKQLSAPAFQLKGTGWYVTDFRDNGRKVDGEGAKAATAGEAGGSNAGASEAKTADKVNAASTETASAAAPAATPAAKPGATKPSTTSTTGGPDAA